MSRSAVLLIAVACLLALLAPSQSRAQQYSSIVIWSEPGIPAVDSAAPSSDFLSKTFPKAHLAAADQLAAQLQDPQTELLILPQGSVVPESA